MPVCSFCKKDYEECRGLTLFTFDGKTIRFCSSKCRRNVDLKRDPKKVKWIKKGKKDKKIILNKELKGEISENLKDSKELEKPIK